MEACSLDSVTIPFNLKVQLLPPPHPSLWNEPTMNTESSATPLDLECRLSFRVRGETRRYLLFGIE